LQKWNYVDAITVAHLGVEGGGLTIYGRELDGTWSFWASGQTIALDDNDDEEWREWTTEPVADLNSLLPAEWPLFFPIEIHPGFRKWFWVQYASAREALPDDLKQNQARHQDRPWKQLLEG
jgi:hypothetical protein